MVSGPAHGPRVDVVELASGARARALVTLAVLKVVLLAMPHVCRDGAAVPRRDGSLMTKKFTNCKLTSFVYHKFTLYISLHKVYQKIAKPITGGCPQETVRLKETCCKFGTNLHKPRKLFINVL